MADESDDSCSTEYNKVPTHLLVQQQMQDLIAIQKARVAMLENDLTAQNETLSNSYVSKDQYETELGRLETSLRNDYVPRDQYSLAVSQLEEEKLEHAETRLRLQEVTDKLEMACEQIKNMKQQLEAEKKAHEKSYFAAM